MPRLCGRHIGMSVQWLPGGSSLAGSGLPTVCATLTPGGPAMRSVSATATRFRPGDHPVLLPLSARQPDPGLQVQPPTDLWPVARPPAAPGSRPSLPGAQLSPSRYADTHATASRPPGATGLQPGTGTGSPDRPPAEVATGPQNPGAPALDSAPARSRRPGAPAEFAECLCLPPPRAAGRQAYRADR